MYTMKKNICKARERRRTKCSQVQKVFEQRHNLFLPLYTTTVSLKWNMVRLNCRLSEPFLYVDPHFKGFGWIKFLWSLWLSEVKSPWTSLNAVFPLLGCSARSSAAAYLWAFLHSVLYLITGKHALLDWDHMTQLAIEKNPLLFLEKLLLLL